MNSSRKRFQKCLLHIGTEKTGTTSVQHYLASNRRELRKQGVIYPVGVKSSHSSLWEFAALAQDEPWKQDTGRAFGITDATSQDRFADDLRQSLENEFSNHGAASTLVISSEHFQSRLHREESIAKLKAFLDPWVESYEVVIFFRRQDRFALSLLSTLLKSAVQLPEVPATELLRITPRYYEYNMIFQRWMNIFGLEAMNAQIYKENHIPGNDIVAEFCRAASIPQLDVKPTQLNVSLNKKGFHFLRALNEIAPTIPGSLSNQNRVDLVRAVSANFAGKYYPISRDEAQEFYNEYQLTNKNLQSIAFPDHKGDLFDDDFSEYPVAAEALEPDYREMVEVALHVWSNRAAAKSNMAGIVKSIFASMKPRG